MKDANLYDIDILAHAAWWLMHWKKVVLSAVLCAAAVLAFSQYSFQPPSVNSTQYRKIDTALTARETAEKKLITIRKDLEDNQYYLMDPEKLCTKQLTVSVVLEDPSLVTEQIDPTDLVLYTYHTAAETNLRRELMEAELLTRLEQEQLLSIGFDNGTNTLRITMTSDDEAVMDRVLAAAAQWYLDQQRILSDLTQPHTLTLLPVSARLYDRKTAEAMISPLDMQTQIRDLEGQIFSQNSKLDECFQKGDGWASSRTTDLLRQAYEAKIIRESRAPVVAPLAKGFCLGLAAMLFWYSLSLTVKGVLLGADGIFHLTGWTRIGRCCVLPKRTDPVVRFGVSLLYPEPEREEAALRREVLEMTELLLEDRKIHRPCTICLVGNVSDSGLASAAACFAQTKDTVEMVDFSRDRIGANRACRRADAVLFVGRADRVTLQDVEEVCGILVPLEKSPLGYILVS